MCRSSSVKRQFIGQTPHTGAEPAPSPFCAAEVTSLPWLLPGPAQLQPLVLAVNSSTFRL